MSYDAALLTSHSLLSLFVHANHLFAIPPTTNVLRHCFLFFFFNDTATTEIYTLSLHDALPIYRPRRTPAPAASADGAPALSRSRPARRSRGHGVSRVPRPADGRGGRASDTDAHPAVRAPGPLSVSQDDRRVRLHLPVGRPSLAARQCPRPGVHYAGPLPRRQRAERHR